MNAAGISGVVARKRRRTTVRLSGVRVASDLVERDFRLTGPDQTWSADIPRGRRRPSLSISYNRSGLSDSLSWQQQCRRPITVPGAGEGRDGVLANGWLWFQIGRAAARSLARWVTGALTPLGRVC